MEHMNMEERIAIRDSARSLKKYGSTSNYNCKRQYDRFVKHQVQQTDTLQGLALKYGVTMEDIRRANRLWANDSLFLREWLLIPSEGGAAETLETTPTREQNGQREDSPEDFLVRIDCAIASTKSQLITSSDSLNSLEEERWGKRDTGRQAEVVVMTQGRRVRDSLHRLQKESDEIFEL